MKVIHLFMLEITELNIPTAIPLVYEFDENMNVVKDFYLADPEELEAQINKVKKQTSSKWYSLILTFYIEKRFISFSHPPFSIILESYT